MIRQYHQDRVELIGIEFELVIFRHQYIDIGETIVGVTCLEFVADEVEIGQIRVRDDVPVGADNV